MLSGTLRDGQIVGAPAGEAAAQIERLGEALPLQLTHRGGGERASGAIDDHRFFLEFFQRIPCCEDLVGREMACADDVTSGEFLRLAYIEHQRTLILQPDHLLRRHRRRARATLAHLVGDDQDGSQYGEAHEPRVIAGVL